LGTVIGAGEFDVNQNFEIKTNYRNYEYVLQFVAPSRSCASADVPNPQPKRGKIVAEATNRHRRIAARSASLGARRGTGRGRATIDNPDFS